MKEKGYVHPGIDPVPLVQKCKTLTTRLRVQIVPPKFTVYIGHTIGLPVIFVFEYTV